MKTMYEEALRAGFEIAVDHAEVSEDDGWQRTAPFVEWGPACKALEAAVQTVAAAVTAATLAASCEAVRVPPPCAWHPQAYVWPSATGPRCAICGRLLHSGDVLQALFCEPHADEEP